MRTRSVLLLAAIAAACSLSSACGVLISRQSYGSPTRGHTISEGASRADVIASMGSPNSIYSSKDTEAFVYKGSRGINILGLYSSLKRQDTVVVMDANGIVLAVTPIEVGSGWTIISNPFTDSTHPVRTGELLFDPENYDYTSEQQRN